MARRTSLPVFQNRNNYLCCIYVLVCYISTSKKRLILEVLAAATVMFTVLWDVMPCSLVIVGGEEEDTLYSIG
jgi:hypothetical protein